MKPSLQLLFLTLLLSSVRVEAYFNRIMGCKEFCKMLSESEVHQFWCMLDICGGKNIRNHVMSYAKRSQPMGSPNLLRLLKANTGIPSKQWEKREKEFWDDLAPAEVNQ